MSSHSKGWQARRGSSQTRSEHPGSAIRWGEQILEVVAADPQADGGMRYRLEPWQDRHAIRVIETYDEASESARAREQVVRAQSLGTRWACILLSPLLGHLPGDVQHRLETEHSAPARWMTVVSALPIFTYGFLGLLNGLVGFTSGTDYFPWAPPLLIAAYLTGESAVRIASAWIAERPMGSAAGVLLYRAVEIVLGRRLSRAPERSVPGRSVGPMERATDRFQMLEPFLALLPEPDQEILRRRFVFDPLKWGRFSVAVLFVVGGLNLVSSLLTFAGGVGGPVDAVWLAAGAAICAEQFVRRSSISRGRPRGSVLGILVRPLAAPLLAPEAGG